MFLSARTLTQSGQWFEIVETAFTETEWYDNFRVSRSTFDYIVREIQDEIVRPKARRLIREKLVRHGQSFTLHTLSELG